MELIQKRTGLSRRTLAILLGVTMIAVLVPFMPRFVGATPPAVSNCGTDPSVIGTDTYGIVTLGSGILVTSCTLTFAVPWDSETPVCVLTSSTGVVALGAVATDTEIQITTGLGFGGGSIMYHCSEF